MRMDGEKVFLRILGEEDVTERYLGWMHDPDVVRWLECRWRSFTLADLRAYVAQVNRSDRDFLFGIFEMDTGLHVGNIKVGCIDFVHRYGDIGLLLGEKSVWGKGYGSEAIALATRYAFLHLNLHKVFAGIYGNNLGSAKAFYKAGYRDVGIFKSHRFTEGGYVDELVVEKLQEWEAS